MLAKIATQGGYIAGAPLWLHPRPQFVESGDFGVIRGGVKFGDGW